SSSSLAGRRPNSKRDAVSKKVDLAQRSSIRMPRYSRTPRWPSTSLTADLAAGTPANPGMKSCGIFLPPASVRFYLGVSEIDAELDDPSDRGQRLSVRCAVPHPFADHPCSQAMTDGLRPVLPSSRYSIRLALARLVRLAGLQSSTILAGHHAAGEIERPLR